MHAPVSTREVRGQLSLKERYVAMTRGLAWNTTYQPMEKVFPYDRYEGIRVHDWDRGKIRSG
jgi:phenol hydroxylase P3 protein